MKFAYQIDYVARFSTFHCRICDQLVTLDYPMTYQDAHEIFGELSETHKHAEPH